MILRNIIIAQNILNIDIVNIPDQFSAASDLIQHAFPTLNVKEFYDDCYIDEDNNGRNNNSSNKFELPINSLIHDYSNAASTSSLGVASLAPGNNHIHKISTSKGSLIFDVVTYPWEFLNAVQNVLQNEVTLP